MATVIDKLIVTLGLDPSDFNKGQKQAAAAVVQTKTQVKRANEEMGASFAATAKKFLGAVAVIALLKKMASALADVASETRQLGLDSQNFGLAANRMRNFQNAVEMMGGKAEDATATIAGLQKAVYDLTVNGQSSASVEMLNRLGVQFQDATGHARSFNDILLDTADSLERAQKNGTLNRQEAFFAAKQAGFDDGSANLILSGRKNIQAELAKQGERHQVSAEDIAAATSIRRALTEKDQRLQSAGVQADSVGVAAAGNVKEMYNAAVAKTTDAMEGLAHAVDKAKDALTPGGLDRMTAGFSTAAQRRQNYQGTIDSASRKYGIPGNILSGLLKTESNYDPRARSAAGAVGVAQFMPDVARRRGFEAGKDAFRDIQEAARFLQELHGKALKTGATGNAAWALALQYYNGGEGRVNRAAAGKGKPLAQETVDYPGKVMAAAAAATPTPSVSAGRGAGTSTINVGPVTVHSAATDANGIASDMGGAVRRKMNVAQVEPGMQ